MQCTNVTQTRECVFISLHILVYIGISKMVLLWLSVALFFSFVLFFPCLVFRSDIRFVIFFFSSFFFRWVYGLSACGKARSKSYLHYSYIAIIIIYLERYVYAQRSYFKCSVYSKVNTFSSIPLSLHDFFFFRLSVVIRPTRNVRTTQTR